jgi:hypothetical protein
MAVVYHPPTNEVCGYLKPGKETEIQKYLENLLQNEKLQSSPKLFLDPTNLRDVIETDTYEGKKDWDTASDLHYAPRLANALPVFFLTNEETLRSVYGENESFKAIYDFIAEHTVEILLIVDQVDLENYFDMILKEDYLVFQLIETDDLMYFLSKFLDEKKFIEFLDDSRIQMYLK